MITKVVTVYEGSVESLGNSTRNTFELIDCNENINKGWNASINGYEGDYYNETFTFDSIPYEQTVSSRYMIQIVNGKLVLVDPGQVDPGFVYNIVVKKTVILPDPDYTRSNDILGALKYFYASAADDDELVRLHDAHSVLDAIRAHYGNVEGKNIADLLNNMSDEGITPGGGGSGISFVTFYLPDSLTVEEIRCSHSFDEIVNGLESFNTDRMPAIGKTKDGMTTWIYAVYTFIDGRVYYDELGIVFNNSSAPDFYMESDGTFSLTSIHADSDRD